MTATDLEPTGSVARLECGVDWPPGHVAAYLLSGRELTLVDAGMTGESGTEELRAGLDDHGYRLADVDNVVLTHAHVDHVGQVQTLLDSGEPTVYAPAVYRERGNRELEAVREASRETLQEAGLESTFLDPTLDHVVDSMRTVRDSLPLDAVDVWVEPDEAVDVGDHLFEPIYTPGHHVTHTSYGVELGSERVLFSGDVAIEYFRSVTIHVGLDDGVRDGVSVFRDTLDRLGEYSFDRVFPGHGPVHTRYAGAIEESVADLDDRIETCLECLDDEGLTAVDVARQQTDGVEEAARLLPEVVGSLATLERDGRALSWHDGDVRCYAPT